MEENVTDEYFPNEFVYDCSRLVGYALNTRLETELVSYLPDAFKSDAKRDRFITCLWLVIFFQDILSRTFRLRISGLLARSPQWFSNLLVSDGFLMPHLYNEVQTGNNLAFKPKGEHLGEFLSKLTSHSVWEIQENGWSFDVKALSDMAKRVVPICRECGDSTADRLLSAMDEHPESKGWFGVSDMKKQLFVVIKEAIRNEATLQAVAPSPSVDQLLADLRDKRARGEIAEEEYVREKKVLEMLEEAVNIF